MTKSRTVWILNHNACGAGQEHRHVNFAKELTKFGAKVVLFAASFEHNSYEETKEYKNKEIFLKEVQEEGYERIFIKTPKYCGNGLKRIINMLVFSFRAVMVGRLNIEKPSVVIGSSPHLFTGLAAYCLARNYKVPFIFEVRDLWPQTLIDLGALREKGIVTWVFKTIEKFLYNKSDKIISLLPNGVEYISSLGIEAEKVVYIPNGADVEWHDKCVKNGELDVELSEYFEKTKGLIFTYTGAHGRANGLETIVEAANLLQQRNISEINLLLIGHGPEREKLINKANEIGLKNITFVSKIEKEQVPLVLDRSDVCVSAVKRSKVHRYGVSMRKLFDYMASGKPMISALESYFDFAEVAECGIAIPPDDPNVLVEAILKLAAMEPEARRKLGANGREYVLKHHESKVLGKRLDNLLDTVCGR